MNAMAVEGFKRESGMYGSVELEPLPRANHSMLFSSRLVTAFLLGTTLLMWIALSSGRRHENARGSTSDLDATLQAHDASISIYNWYSKRYGKIGEPYPWLGEGEVIIDVAMPCWVEVSSPEDEEYEVRTTHASTGDATVSHTKGKVAQLVLMEYGTYIVTVFRQSIDVDASGRTPVAVNPIAPPRVLHALRVRHEVRELKPEDRDRLLDTMKIMWETGGEAGRALYGNEFVSAREFQIWHHINAAQRDADHFHQGFGFFAQHARITLQFEASLRAIEPKVVACPYWDWTIDATHAATGKQAHVFDSVLFSPTWWGTIRFGNFSMWNSLPNVDVIDAFRIPDGRFADLRSTRAPKLGDDLSGLRINVHNAFGLVRAPWNNNPSLFVTRFVDEKIKTSTGVFPTCADHLKATTTPYPLALWMWNVQDGPHANVHATIGGLINTQDASPELIEKLQKLSGMPVDGSSAPSIVKAHTLYRLGILDYPSQCDDYRSCLPTCNTDRWSLEQIGRQILLSRGVDMVPGFIRTRETFDPLFKFSGDEYVKAVDVALNALRATADAADPSELHALAELYCAHPPVDIEGDQKDSSGSLDPLFWTIHPTMERLYLRRLFSGVGFSDYTWPHDGACGASRSDVAVSNRDGFIFGFPEPTLGIRNSAMHSANKEMCAGHFADSLMFCNAPLMRSPEFVSKFVDGRLAKYQNRTAAEVFCAVKSAPDYDSGTFYDLMKSNTRLGRTNAQILALMDPRRPPVETDFEYPVYHHFKMRHCEDVGFTFPNVEH